MYNYDPILCCISDNEIKDIIYDDILSFVSMDTVIWDWLFRWWAKYGIGTLYISLFLNKPLEYKGIENYKAIYKYIQLQWNRNEHSD